MSDIKDDFNQKLEADIEMDRKKKEVQKRKLILDDKRTSFELDRLTRNEDDLSRAQNVSFGASTEEHIEYIQKENDDYIEAAKHSMMFINPEFNGVVPFFRKNLILIGGKTGEGKSTTVANIVFSTITQKNPTTGNLRKVLVLSNEEVSPDVYNRITCLAKGWSYTNHDKFTPEQVRTFREWIPKLARGGRLTVVDNNYGGIPGMTTSIEGIQTIFDNLIRDRIYYDAVIIDYYQNIKYSKKNPDLTEYQVQAMLANMLDRYKNEYPAPIVILAQVNPPRDEDDRTPFEYRIKGRKVITDPATLIMEMQADRESLRTQWTVHKGRFTEANGKSFYTGYDRGKFVEYGTEFIKKVNEIKEKRMMMVTEKHSDKPDPEQD